MQGRKKLKNIQFAGGGGVGPGNNRATDYVYSPGTLNKKTITYQYNGGQIIFSLSFFFLPWFINFFGKKIVMIIILACRAMGSFPA